MLTDITSRYPPTSGFLFIGDPHLWSKRPGRRRDESFLSTILGKISVAAEIANQQNLLPIFLGDMFHDEDDFDPAFLVQVVVVLKKFNRKPITLTGNHEKKENLLTERDALYLLNITQQIDVIDLGGIFGTMRLVRDGCTSNVLLGGTPFGQEPPISLADLYASKTNKKNKTMEEYHAAIKNELGVDFTVWLTHDDYAFENAYPGARALTPVFGVDMLVNGHMHATKKPYKAGETAYYNPGNITRMSIDQAEHLPSVWSWSPFDHEQMHTSQGVAVPLLVQHILPHESGKTVFNHEGRHSQKQGGQIFSQADDRSEFVALLLQDHDLKRTDDGAFIQESLRDYYASNTVPDEVRGILSDLLQRSVGVDRQRD